LETFANDSITCENHPMKIIPKSVGSILILGALAGCAGDDGAAPESSTPPSPGQAPTKSVSVPPRVRIADEDAKLGEGKMETAKPGTNANPAPAAGKKADDAPIVEGPTSKPAGAAAKLTDEDLAGIKELPKAEQDVAIAQVMCPVSSENLGSMGKPIKVTAEGRSFYLCCKNCEKEVKTDPKGVLAKLDKLKAGK
jgi:hypothetical protein